MAEQQLLQFDRTPKFADSVNGYVVAIGSQWILVAVAADGGYFDGHAALRLGDLRAIRKDETFEPILRRQPEWPPTTPRPDINLDSVGELLMTVGSHDSLVGIEKENEFNDLWIGVVRFVTKKHVALHEINPQARWHPAALGYKLKSITKVTEGSRYQGALREVAPPTPDEKTNT